MNIKTAFLMRWLLLLLAATALPGCVTHALWEDANLGTRHQPAADTNLRLFRIGNRGELLALYNESVEGQKSTLSRAYLVYQNERRVTRQQPPKFVKLDSTRGLDPVPVFPNAKAAADSPLPPLYVILSTDKLWFEVYSSGTPVGTFALPTYRDGMAQAERIALTPLAVTADATLVGSAVAAIYGLARAENYGHFDVNPWP